jgi:plasmid stabilization system protein ParE
MRNVVIMARARQQIDRAAAWWDDHRDKAPEAFEEDLSSGIAAIAENASTGSIVRRGPVTLRRILLPRVRYYLYYRLRNETIEVISIWHSSRRSPRL